MKHLLVLIAVAAAALPGFAQTRTQPTAGDIKGRVTDQNGAPVAAATVYAVPQGLTLDDITPRSVKTDSNGNFDFRGGFGLGAYQLYSRKDSDSYPDPFDRFYSDPKTETPKVNLTAAHPSATATVKLGPQAGVVAGRVIDADTGAVLKATVFFLDAQGHGHHADTAPADGGYRALLPAGKDLTLMVEVQSPQDNPALVPIAPLRLEPGQYMYMDIPVPRQ
jgi:hypothetical protein